MQILLQVCAWLHPFIYTYMWMNAPCDAAALIAIGSAVLLLLGLQQAGPLWPQNALGYTATLVTRDKDRNVSL